MFKKIQRWAEIITTQYSLWQLLMGAAAFGIPAWAVKAANLFSQYAPASWVAAGFAGFFVYCLGAYIVALARQMRLRVRFQERVLSTALVNPLARTFANQRIRIHDLCPPVGGIIKDKVFVDCEIVGPANVIFVDCTMSKNGGNAVDGVIIADGPYAKNGFGFYNCSFSGCQFYLVTFMVPEKLYNQFSLYNWSGVNWLTPVPNPLLPFDQGAGSAPQLPPSTAP